MTGPLGLIYLPYAEVAELADARDSNSRSFGSVGSIPTFGTGDYSIGDPSIHLSAHWGRFHFLHAHPPYGKIQFWNIMKRFTPLLLGLVIGLVLGLLYGWLIRPIEYVDTSPGALREDYRGDYVLMVAEAYAGDQDLELARIRLASLGPHPPVNFVVQGIDYGLENGYSQSELETLNQLAVDLRSAPASSEIILP